MFMVPAQFIDCLLVDSLGHVRPRLSNDVFGDYWRVRADYYNQWLVAVARAPQTQQPGTQNQSIPMKHRQFIPIDSYICKTSVTL